MAEMCDPQDVVDKLEELSDSEGSKIEFPLDNDTIASVAQTALKTSTGMEIPIDDIKANKDLMNSYKVKMTTLKGEMGDFVEQTEMMSKNIATDVSTTIASATPESAGVATSAMKTQKHDWEVTLKTLASQATGILGTAAALGIGLPPAFMTAISTIGTIKTIISNLPL